MSTTLPFRVRRRAINAEFELGRYDGFNGMKYDKTIRLKDGRTLRLRNGEERDARDALAIFILGHEQTDYLLSYPDENDMTVDDEARFLEKKATSADEIELLASIGDRIVGLAGIERVGRFDKIKRRATFGLHVDQEFWGLGIGRALTRACVECARIAGYAQLELEVVAENERAVALYRSEGFVEFGRNPRGFLSRKTGWRELTLMRLELY